MNNKIHNSKQKKDEWEDFVSKYTQKTEIWNIHIDIIKPFIRIRYERIFPNSRAKNIFSMSIWVMGKLLLQINQLFSIYTLEDVFCWNSGLLETAAKIWNFDSKYFKRELNLYYIQTWPLCQNDDRRFNLIH